MKASNPFQPSSCLQKADPQRRRRLFRNGFLAALGAHVILFLALLIQGCRNQPGLPSQALSAPAAEQVITQSKPVAPAPNGSFYIVKSGDTLARIAKREKTTIAAIRKSNPLNNDRLVVGLRLRIPAS